MNPRLAVSVVLVGMLSAGPTRADAPLRFDATLRVDLYHLGDHKTERFILDGVRVEGPWPGSRTHLTDDTGQGCASAEVRAAGAAGRLLHGTTYCTMFGEWQTTGEARSRSRVFSETVRFPMPSERVVLTLKTRDRRGRMVKVFETLIDPLATDVATDRRGGGLRTARIHGAGPPETSLDIVLLGDGYEAWQMPKYRRDASRFAEELLATEPFARHRERINIWTVESPSRQSGVDEPRKGIFRDTALSMTFNTFGSERYLMTADNRAVRDVAANAPYDAIFIMSNTSRYGGGGIYNLYASFVSDNEYDEYVAVHEFGHSFGALADEYYTSSVAYGEMYPRGVEPWEPNITAERRRARIKWRDLIPADTPVPTPAQDPAHAASVGLFEGAGYSAKGLYRSAVDCKMFDKGHRPFCPVCARAVSRMIERHLR